MKCVGTLLLRCVAQIRIRVSAENTLLATRYDSLKNDVAVLRREAAAARQELMEARSEGRTSQDRLATELRTLQAQRDELQNLLSAQESHVQSVHDALEKLQDDRQLLSRELIALERLEKDQREVVAELRQAEQTVRQEAAQRQVQLGEAVCRAETAEQRCQEAETQLAALRMERQTLMTELEALKGAKLPTTTEEYNRMTALIEQQREIITVQTKKIADLEETARDLTETKECLRAEVSETAERLSATRQALRESEAREASLREHAEARRAALVDDAHAKRQLQEAADRWRAQAEAAGAQLLDKEALLLEKETELSALRVQVADAEHGSGASERIEELEALNARLRDDLATTIATSKELHQHVSHLRSTGRVLSEEEAIALQDLHVRRCAVQSEAAMRRARLTVTKSDHLHLPGAFRPKLESVAVQVGRPGSSLTAPEQPPHRAAPPQDNSTLKELQKTQQQLATLLQTALQPKSSLPAPARYTVSGKFDHGMHQAYQHPLSWQRPTHASHARQLQSELIIENRLAREEAQHQADLNPRRLGRRPLFLSSAYIPSSLELQAVRNNNPVVFRRNRPNIMTRSASTPSKMPPYRTAPSLEEDAEAVSEGLRHDLNRLFGLTQRHGTSFVSQPAADGADSPTQSFSSGSSRSPSSSSSTTTTAAIESGAEMSPPKQTTDGLRAPTPLTDPPTTTGGAKTRGGTESPDTPSFGGGSNIQSLEASKQSLIALRSHLLGQGVL